MVKDLPIILVDIDGTVAEWNERKEIADSPNPNWFEYYYYADVAKVNKDVRLAVLDDSESHEIIFVTARPEWTRGRTWKWLCKNCLGIGRLIMRPNHDLKRPDHEVKADLVRRIIKNVVTFYEDDEKVVKAYEQLKKESFYGTRQL